MTPERAQLCRHLGFRAVRPLLDCWSPELSDKSVLFEAAKFVAICYSCKRGTNAVSPHGLCLLYKHLSDMCEVYVITWKVLRTYILKAVYKHVYIGWLKLCLQNKETKPSFSDIRSGRKFTEMWIMSNVSGERMLIQFPFLPTFMTFPNFLKWDLCGEKYWN